MGMKEPMFKYKSNWQVSFDISKPGVTYGGLHSSTSSAVDNLKFTM